MKAAVRTVSTTSTRISSASSQKKKNRSHFPSYYADLCQMQNIHPLQAVKQHLDKGVLDFIADRIKYEEWWPIINALSCDKTLHFIAIRSRHATKFPNETMDTEAKVRGICKQPLIKTKFVLMWLMDALKICLAQSPTLTVLELEGLSLGPDYVSALAKGIIQSTSIQHLSLFKSNIQDEGTEVICAAIKNLPSVITLDLSWCGLTEHGCSMIAGLVKFQKLNRYSEAWKQTLRYRDPDVEAMPGLRRITLNGNEKIGDGGVYYLVEEIKDDLWLRALDLQTCGISDEGGKMLLDLVECNVNLIVVDARRNSYLTQSGLSEIMNRLAINNADKVQSDYKWITDTSNSKFMPPSSRPRTCQSVTQLSGRRSTTPSEISFATTQKSVPPMKRSQTTLNQKDWNKKVAVNKTKTVTPEMEQKLKDHDTMKIRIQELEAKLGETFREKMQLVRENHELKAKISRYQKDNQNLSAISNDKLRIQTETLGILENIVQRFGKYINTEQGPGCSNQNKENDDFQLRLKDVLQGHCTNETQFGEIEENVTEENLKEDDEIIIKKDQTKREKTCLISNRSDTIWEEDEETQETNQSEPVKIRSMFTRYLGGDGDGKKPPLIVQLKVEDDSEKSDSGEEPECSDSPVRTPTSSEDYDSDYE